MDAPQLTLVDATPSHFAAILAIERASGAGSIVALTEGLALDEALRRGHYITVAMDGDTIAGWIWFLVDLDRGGEEVGQVFRVAVAPERRLAGVGRALVEHARETLAQRRCVRLRATIDGDNADARAFFARMGFAVDAVTMERAL